MIKTRSALVAGAVLAESIAFGTAYADNFIDRGTAFIDFHNYYFDRQFQDNPGAPYKSRYREWAQAINFTYKSDFTEGPVGFGFDLKTLTGIKLDSTPRQSGTGLLPLDSDGRAEDEYSTLGFTAKIRAAKSELNVGQLVLNLPLTLSSPARLQPQTFNGAYLRSEDISGLALHLGHLDKIKYRDSSNNEKITVSTPNARFRQAESSGMTFVGADYKATDELTVMMHGAELEDIYKQQYLGLVHVAPVGGGSLKTDVRLQFSQEDGDALAGPVDNQHLGVVFRYKYNAHRISVGYMQLFGDTGQPYMGRSEPSPVVEGAMSTDFLNAKERTWQIREDYDFAAMGVPGLTGTLWHMRGDGAQLPESMGGKNRSERETQAALAYTVRSGPLKAVTVRLRHAWYRNNFEPTATFRDNNEFRINVYYTWKLW
ncbi:TPA: OprD family outer membrane porin [Pseudomonas aeruginosa]|nr:OprD family outer membrane porin [Pseudomonas aeruginosa]